MERSELEITDAVTAIERELRKLRDRNAPRDQRQLAARMIHNLAAVAVGTLQRAPESVTPRG